MNEILTKPMSMRKKEFMDQLVNDVNNCELPLFVVELILQNVLNVVQEANKNQYEMEKTQYEQQLKLQNESNSSEDKNI